MSRGDRPEAVFLDDVDRQGWTEADLMSQRKKAPGKLDLAARLRRETPMSLKWIAARVHLGTSKSAHGKLHAWMKNQRPARRQALNHKKLTRRLGPLHGRVMRRNVSRCAPAIPSLKLR